MGRPPSNGGPSFRFNPVEVGEMEAILQAHNYTVPSREILEALAQRFSNSADRTGKVEVSGKQVWNWFQNRRYALRAKAARTSVPGQVNMPAMPRDDQSVVRSVPQAPQPQVSQAPPAPTNMVRSMPQVPQPLPIPSVQNASRNVPDNSLMEFEAKSARDGAWYDVASFLSHRSLESGDPEAMVRFAGFGQEEDEWVNIRRHIRQRSLPCESSECVAVLPGDLILCFQEGKEQALYFDAHVLDAQRRRHDARGCRCRFLVRYDHDQSEEIVPLRKICRRPETDHRLRQLHAMQVNMNLQKSASEVQEGNTMKLDTSADNLTQKQPKQEERVVMFSATPTTVPHPPESKLQPSKAADAGNAPPTAVTSSITMSASPTIIPHATESKLQPSKAVSTGNATPAVVTSSTIISASPTTIPHATEFELQSSKAVSAGNATHAVVTSSTIISASTTIPQTTEFELQPSKAVTAGNATPATVITSSTTIPATPPTVPHVTECNLQPAKTADAGNAIPITIPHTTESNLQLPENADAGNAIPITIPPTTESNLQQFKVADAGNTTPTTVITSSTTTPATLTTAPHTTEYTLQPLKTADAGNATPTTVITSSIISPATSTTVPHATVSTLQPTKDVDTRNATPTTVMTSPTTNPATSNTALHTTESELQPAKTADAENAAVVANIVSLNAVESTAASGVTLPTLPQG